jgi:protoporphyrinogen/coproporphyrinogen III oxidase
VHDVVVVGAGLAGLSAAWTLRDLDVVVLESSDRVGGRVRSERRGRYWLNFGAHVFAGAGSATDALLRETGVEAADVPGVLTGLELDGRVVARRRVESYPFRLPLPLASRLAFVRAGIRIRLGVARYDRVVRTGDTHRVLSHLADRTFAEWLGPVPDDVDAVVRPTLQRSSGEPEELAAGYGIGYFHLVWDRSGGLARNILGGPGTLPEAVAAVLGERVRLRTPVVEIARDGGGVRVVLESGEDLRARAVVVATQAHVTRDLVPDLPEDTRAALGSISYGPYVLAAILTNEDQAMPWDGIYAVAAARRSFNLFFNMANVLRPGEAAREPGGSLMVYSGAGLGRRLWDEDDARVRELYLADLDGMFPGASAVVEEVVVHRWERGVPYVRPGRHRLQDALERPLAPVFLAGDYLGIRYTETAIATGRAAAGAARGHLGRMAI